MLGWGAKRVGEERPLPAPNTGPSDPKQRAPHQRFASFAFSSSSLVGQPSSVDVLPKLAWHPSPTVHVLFLRRSLALQTTNTSPADSLLISTSWVGQAPCVTALPKLPCHPSPTLHALFQRRSLALQAPNRGIPTNKALYSFYSHSNWSAKRHERQFFPKMRVISAHEMHLFQHRSPALTATSRNPQTKIPYLASHCP
jgi:hypothetical protein